MEKYHKEWKSFITESEVGHEVDSVLVYDKERRNQTYTLHDIREIEGVRVVTVTSPVETHGGEERVEIMIKYDIPRGKTPDGYISFLRAQIKVIEGVTLIRFLRVRKVEI